MSKYPSNRTRIQKKQIVNFDDNWDGAEVKGVNLEDLTVKKLVKAMKDDIPTLKLDDWRLLFDGMRVNTESNDNKCLFNVLFDFDEDECQDTLNEGDGWIIMEVKYEQLGGQ